MADEEIKGRLSELNERLDKIERRLDELESAGAVQPAKPPVEAQVPPAQPTGKPAPDVSPERQPKAEPDAVTGIPIREGRLLETQPAAQEEISTGIPIGRKVQKPAQAQPAQRPAQAAAQRPAQRPPSPTASAKTQQSIEMFIGAKVFLWIGVIAVVVAGGFFFALAVQQGWINETMRVIIGVLVGIGMIVLGELARSRKHPYWGQTIAGGGIAILYLSIFAAFQLYDLINVLGAYAFMFVITTSAILLSVRYNGQGIAILGLIGGFLTPVMLSTGEDNQIGLFSYILMLDLGILVIAYFKRWLVLDLLALLGTIFVFLGWLAAFYEDEKLGLTILFLSIFYVVFTLLSFFHNIAARKKADAWGLIILTLTAIWYYATAVPLLWDHYEDWIGLFTVLLAGVSLTPAILVIRRLPQDKFLTNVYLSLAVVFLVLAVPMQVDAQYVTIAWAIEGLILTWVGFRLDRPWLRRSAYLIAVLILGRLLIFDSLRLLYEGPKPEMALLNDRSLAFFVSLLALYAWAWLYNPQKRKPADEMTGIRTTLFILVPLLFVLWGTIEIHQHFDIKSDALDYTADDYYQLKENLYLSFMLTLSAFYALVSISLLALGIALKKTTARWLALSLFGLTILKVFIFDLSSLETIWRVLSFVVLGVILIISGLLYALFRKRIEQFVSHGGDS